METNLKPGIRKHFGMRVCIDDTAARYGSGLIEVFATPALVGLMESTAQLSVQPYLPEGYITLGIEINVKHLKATPVGMQIFCESTLTAIDGKKLWFDLKAWDEKGDIGTATHIRYIVDKEKFMKKLTNQ